MIDGLLKNESLLTGGLCVRGNDGVGYPYTTEEITRLLLDTRKVVKQERKRANDLEAKLRAVREMIMDGWK